MSQWSNWSGRIRCRPTEHLTPASLEQVVSIVDQASAAGKRVTIRGSGHSNTALCASDEILIAPEGLSGPIQLSADRATARVPSGTVLADLAAALHGEGLALHNLGDVDVQTIAGAVATATHGTGRELGNLATAVRGAQVVLADGSVSDCSPACRPELFAALLPSLGAVGVITEFLLEVIPSYRLHERIWFAPGSSALDSLAANVAATRHYEFFWHPHRDLVEHKASTITDADPDPLLGVKRERIDHWHRVLPSRREMRFNEMEFSLPSESGPACFAALRTRMLDRWSGVEWPVEYRTVAGDDLWLSPHEGRASVTISVHQDAGQPCEPLFEDAAAILSEHGGRPHWGKVHFCPGPQLRDSYQHWDRWWSVRDRFDPNGVFLNPYLETFRTSR